MMPIKACLTCISAVLLSCVTEAKNIDKYTIGVENIDYYPHYAFGHRSASFAKTILKAFFEEENISITFIPLPLKRFNRWYEEDKIDFKYPDNPEWRADEAVLFDIVYSKPVVISMAGSVVHKDNTDFELVDIKRLGTIAGFYPTLWIERIKAQKTQLVEDNNVVLVVKSVLHRMVDAINLDYSVVNYHLGNMNRRKHLVLSSRLPYNETPFHLSSIEHPELILRFNDFLKNNKEFIATAKRQFGIIDNPFDLSSF